MMIRFTLSPPVTPHTLFRRQRHDVYGALLYYERAMRVAALWRYLIFAPYAERAAMPPLR